MIDLFGHLSFGLIAVSYAFRDMLFLRTMSIVASFGGIAYNYAAPAHPLWLVIYWNMGFIMVNALQLILLVRERRGVFLSAEELELHQDLPVNKIWRYDLDM